MSNPGLPLSSPDVIFSTTVTGVWDRSVLGLVTKKLCVLGHWANLSELQFTILTG